MVLICSCDLVWAPNVLTQPSITPTAGDMFAPEITEDNGYLAGAVSAVAWQWYQDLLLLRFGAQM